MIDRDLPSCADVLLAPSRLRSAGTGNRDGFGALRNSMRGSRHDNIRENLGSVHCKDDFFFAFSLFIYLFIYMIRISVMLEVLTDDDAATRP